MGKKALEGIRVIDFSWIGVGPITAMYMAHHGAEIVHIESNTRHDALRHNGPYRMKPDGTFDVGINKSGMFEDNNSNKIGCTLNMGTPQGREIAKRLIAQGDVLIESFTPKAMRNWGLAYNDIIKFKPDIIMISVPIYGQTGPMCMQMGHGVTTPALSGVQYLTGWPDRAPGEIGIPYTDWIGPQFAATFIMAALDHRIRTGKGQYIDLAQYQCAVHALQEVLLEVSVNGRCPERQGNKNPYTAPHGVYQCRGTERWIAITVFNHQQWLALCKVMDKIEWTKEGSKFRTLLGRLDNEDELDAEINAWTRLYTPEQLMATLQATGVPAGVVETTQDLYEDPQLKHRHQWWWLEHPELGLASHNSFAFRMSKTPLEVTTPAPLLGQHNEFVYRELLAMNEEEFVDDLVQGVFE